ncbi:Hypothetical predicted protein [Marmota monax]|uniref:Thioesterase domain-containing protein n=2 Tax=Marmota monax TaxID=9995 RepID=A0A5E4AMP1_MARMO|nr:Hypothetical predicted protein [Marmota monax]
MDTLEKGMICFPGAPAQLPRSESGDRRGASAARSAGLPGTPRHSRPDLTGPPCPRRRERLGPLRVLSEAAGTMASWVSRMRPRNACSLATSSKIQRHEDCHRQHKAYGYFLPIQTRWQDNDQYGHVNNVVYYSYFDTIINHYLIR